MLHILWLIVKIILIILACVLGLALLLLAIVLFVPVRYQAKGRKDQKDLHGAVNVSWLFHGISFWYLYDGKEQKTVLKILGISVGNLRTFFSRFKKKKKEETFHAEEEELMEELPIDSPKEETVQVSEPVEEETVQVPKPVEEISPTNETPLIEQREAEPIVAQKTPPKERKNVFQTIIGFFKKAAVTVKKVFFGILRIPDKIGAKIHQTAKKIKTAENKIEALKALWNNEKVRQTISLLWGDLKKLLKHILPRKISGNIHFGFDDPSLTGQTLGLLGATGFIHKYRIGVVPNFEEPVLDGNVQLKGHIYGCMLVYIAIHIYFNENFKYCRKLLKKKEEL